MSKSIDNKREDGKISKGADYRKPDIDGVLSILKNLKAKNEST
jgi:hypothetical protein